MWQGTNTHELVHNVIEVVYFEIESPLWCPIYVLYPSTIVGRQVGTFMSNN
jgi:hypothetical protein